MLLSFGAKNFFCFKEWVEISLEFNSKVPLEISKGVDTALTLCLKGGNASGKTNAIKILSFLNYFCISSFVGIKPHEEIDFSTFFHNDDPSEIFVEFTIDKINYLYELVLTKKAVVSEKITKKDKRKTIIFLRSKNIIKKNSIFTKKDLILRSNASIISIANQHQIEEIEPFFIFFMKIATNVSYLGTDINYDDEYRKDSEFYAKHKDYLDFAIKNLKKLDTGISNIEIKSFKDDKDDSKEKFYPVFTHDSSSKENKLLFHEQSSGTKSLFHLLREYHLVLKTGGVLLLDEFDLTLHPDMLPYLVEMFENKDSNPQKAQLIFSTHNCDIIDTMSKYKTYLFNRENGECYCYRLDELKDGIIRNDRPITPLYKSGKIGGIPKI